jgi:hypothetical protein
MKRTQTKMRPTQRPSPSERCPIDCIKQVHVTNCRDGIARSLALCPVEMSTADDDVWGADGDPCRFDAWRRTSELHTSHI